MADEIPFTLPAPQANLPPQPSQQSFFDGFSFGGLAASLALGQVTAMLRPARSIGVIIDGVTIEEIARDELEITKHPVEIGAQITDHSYRQPSEVMIRTGWSDSGNLPGYANAVYDQLLTLQASREPFTIVTGKRTYTNMLIASIAQTTDAATENSLIASITCRQIIFAYTQLTQVAPRDQQVQPQTTGATETGGNVVPTPVNNSSVLKMISNAGSKVVGGIGGLVGVPVGPGQ